MLDPTVKKETLRIALGTLVMSVIMQLVFVLLSRWDITVLLGNLLGAFAAVLNFFLMCMTVVRCVGLEQDKAAMKIRASQSGRLLMLAGFAALGAMLPRWFNIVAVLLPLLFPRIIITVYQFTHANIDKKQEKEENRK